jgi:hypothetical protein
MLLLSLTAPGMALAAGEPVLALKAANKGSQLTIDVNGRGLADLYAYQFNLEYDPRLVKFVGAASPISGFTVDPIVKNGDILFAHSKVGISRGTQGEATLATLTFERLTGGEASFTLHGIKLVNSELDMAELETEVKLSSVSLKFSDIAGHWAESSIVEASGRGWVAGYNDGTFRPERQVTRAEFVAMLACALELPVPSEPQLAFADQESIPVWARGYIAAAVNAKAIEGYEDRTFRADKLITRAEMASLIVRSQGIDPPGDARSSFADTDQIPEWARPYIAAAVDRGWMKGVGNNKFAPLNLATRAEAVHLILTVLQDEAE